MGPIPKNKEGIVGKGLPFERIRRITGCQR